jgi:hypothetical protein
MTEQLALTEQIEHAPAVDELHASPPNHAHMTRRRLALAEDDSPGGDTLDLGASRELFQRAVVELGEGFVSA